MQIKIDGITDDRLHRPLQNIANLFFEECVLAYGETEASSDLVISLAISQDADSVSVSGEIKGTDEKEHHTKPLLAGWSEKKYLNR